MPGGWVDYYTERQFNLEDVVQFQHLARPSIITCAKQAVGQAKRRCIQVAASACQAPIYLLTMAQNTQTNIASAMQTVHNTAGNTVNQIVRRVRQIQAAERRRPASARNSPRHSPRLSPRRLPRPAPRPQDSTSFISSTYSSPAVVIPNATSSPQTLPLVLSSAGGHAEAAESPWRLRDTKSTLASPLDHSSTLGNSIGTRSPKQSAGYLDFEDSWDYPSPSHWLDASDEISYIDLNKTQEASRRTAVERQLMAQLDESCDISFTDARAMLEDTQTPISYRTAAQHQLVAELDESTQLSYNDLNEEQQAPKTPISHRTAAERQLLADFEESNELSYIQSNKILEAPKTPVSPRTAAERQPLAEFEEAASSSSEGLRTPAELELPVTPQRNSKPYPSYMEGNASDFSSNVPDTPRDLTDFSSFVPFSPDVVDSSYHIPVIPHEKDEDFTSSIIDFCAHLDRDHVNTADAADNADEFSSYVADFSMQSYHDNTEEFSSYVVDFSTQDDTPDWYEEPASSPFTKSANIAPRRMTRKMVREEEAARQAREEQRQRNLDKAKISALSEEWEDKVHEAVKAGFAPDYTAADFARVAPPQHGRFTDNWLNDESVNGYLKLATKFHNTHHPSTIPKSHAFPSFMLKQIAEKGYRGVERWARRAKIGGADLLQTHTIFIPVNSGSHWTLMVVYPGARVAHYYDSMGRNRQNNGRQWFDLLKIWLRGELGSYYNDREWSFYDKPSPQQNNSSDCGVFAITTAKLLILGANVLGYGPNDIPLQRKRIVAELVNGNFL